MARVIITPEVQESSRSCLERLAPAIYRYHCGSILYIDTQNARDTAACLQKHLTTLDCGEGKTVETMPADFLSRGDKAISRYLGSIEAEASLHLEALEEIADDKGSIKDLPEVKDRVILITSNATAKTLPTYFLQKVLHGREGVLPLQEGKAVVFEYNNWGFTCEVIP